MNALVALARDGSDPARAQLLLSTAEAYERQAASAKAGERDLFVQVATQLLAKAKLDVRELFAERVADAQWAPRALILHLALDEPPVAEKVITRSPVLDDAALIDIIHSGRTPHRCAVAARRGLSSPVARVLIGVGDSAPLMALARNLEAVLDHDTLHAAVKASKSDPDVLSAFVERLDLPSDVVAQAYAAAGAELRDRIVKLYDLDAAIAAREAADAAARAALKSGYALGTPALDDIRAAVFGAPTPGTLLRLLLGGQRENFEAEAAKAVGVALEALRVRARAADPQFVALLSRALGFDQRSAPMLFSELTSDGGRGWSAKAEQDASLIYQTFQPADAIAALKSDLSAPRQ